ncbi:MAG TPA: hypothetical protein VKA86_08810 [Candidatus Krumholzibacteria bacterium]|nr:hypothetical protein [Candidatus Krumholzibacteria bacterium]
MLHGQMDVELVSIDADGATSRVVGITGERETDDETPPHTPLPPRKRPHQKDPSGKFRPETHEERIARVSRNRTVDRRTTATSRERTRLAGNERGFQGTNAPSRE